MSFVTRRASSCQHWWHPGAPARESATCWRCHIPLPGAFSPKYSHNSTVSTMAYLQQAHSSPILRKEKQQRSLSAQPCPFLGEQSLSSSNTTGALWPHSSGAPWLISLSSTIKGSTKLLRAPQGIHSIAKTSLWAWKVKMELLSVWQQKPDHRLLRMELPVECSDPSGTTLATGNLGDFLLTALFFSEGWHEHRNPRKLFVMPAPSQGILWSHQLKFGKRVGFFTLLMHSSTQDFLKIYIKQGKTNAERADLGQFIKVWEIASRWMELFGAGWWEGSKVLLLN